MNNNDNKVFLRYVRGVNPIKRKNKIKKEVKKIPKESIKKTLKIKKKNTIDKKQNDKIKNSQFMIEIGKTNKMLKKGQIIIDKKIDFHGKNLSQAEEIFHRAILESYKQKKRCILFVTGKGLHKQNNYFGDLNKSPKLFYGKIREAFLDWVKKPQLAKYILTTERANIERGGDGAFYVYLRKNKN